MWYRRQHDCLESMRRLTDERDTILLDVKDVPHWFAPYYLAPRKFYYFRPEIVARFTNEERAFRVLRLEWVDSRVVCFLDETPI